MLSGIIKLMKTAMTKRTKIRISFLTGLMILTSFCNLIFATNYETVANGNWTSTSTWKNGIAPGTNIGASHTITIAHTVTLNTNVASSSQITINSGAMLSTSTYKFTLNSANLINNGTFSVKNFDNNSGTITNNNVFTVSSKTNNNSSGSITSSKTISLGKFLNNSGTLTANGTITMSGSSANYSNGKMELNGTITIGTSFSNSGAVAVNGTIVIGSGLVLNSGKVALNGTISMSGTVTISGAEIINNGTSTVTSTFTFNSGSLVNYGTFTLNSITNIYANACISTYGIFYVKGALTNYSKSISIETSDTSTGNFVTMSTVTGDKTITVKRYITHSGWHYVSSPVSNATTDVFTGSAMYSYNETSASWTTHKSGEAMTPGKGYDVYFKNNNKSITFTGNMNTGTVKRSLTKTLSGGNGYNLVGNPYTSAINWDATSGWTKTNVSNAIYVWDMKNNNISAYVNKVGTNGGSNIIPATTGFFVLCTSTSGGTLSMTDAVKVNSKVNFREASNENVMRVKISNGSRFDETVIRFDEQATNNFDHEFDAEKMYSFDVATPQIFSFSKENIDLAISTMNLSNEAVSVKLGYIANAEGNFSLTFNFENFTEGVNVYLEDVSLGKLHDLKTGNYNFEAQTGENTERFILHFIPVQSINYNTNTNSINTTTNTYEIDTVKTTVFSAEKKIYVKTNNLIKLSEVKVFSVSGQEVFSGLFNGNQLNTIDMSAYSGCFIVKVIAGDQITSSKVIIQ